MGGEFSNNFTPNTVFIQFALAPQFYFWIGFVCLKSACNSTSVCISVMCISLYKALVLHKATCKKFAAAEGGIAQTARDEIIAAHTTVAEALFITVLNDACSIKTKSKVIQAEFARIGADPYSSTEDIHPLIWGEVVRVQQEGDPSRDKKDKEKDKDKDKKDKDKDKDKDKKDKKDVKDKKDKKGSK